MLHFKEDENEFTKCALELLLANTDVRKLKQVGVDMESAIQNGFQHEFSDLV